MLKYCQYLGVGNTTMSIYCWYLGVCNIFRLNLWTNLSEAVDMDLQYDSSKALITPSAAGEEECYEVHQEKKSVSRCSMIRSVRRRSVCRKKKSDLPRTWTCVQPCCYLAAWWPWPRLSDVSSSSSPRYTNTSSCPALPCPLPCLALPNVSLLLFTI